MEHTLIVRAAVIGAATRQVGVVESMPVSEFLQVIAVCFDLQAAPLTFDDADPHAPISFYLDTAPIAVLFGVLPVVIEVVESFPRDNGTPRALCIGGSGHVVGDIFHQGPVDVSIINQRLTRPEDVDAAFAVVHPEAAAVIIRSQFFDYIPLIQALDIPSAVPVPDIVGHLPTATDPVARDAFWCVVLGQATMAAPEVAAEIATTTFAALGYEGDPAVIAGADAAALDSLADLPPVLRIDYFRFLLANAANRRTLTGD